MSFSLSSAAFLEGERIPSRHTCDGQDVSPPLSWKDVPAGTGSFALIVHDPDAPRGDWVHWVLFDLPPGFRDLPEAFPAEERPAPGGVSGVTDFGRTGYGGPCPPSGTHRYVFAIYALDAPLDLPPRATRGQVEKAMGGHVLGEARLTGTYSREKASR